jgi:hypothetical protein
MALPPCHMFCQFYVDTDKGELSCQMYQVGLVCLEHGSSNEQQFLILLAMFVLWLFKVLLQYCWAALALHMHTVIKLIPQASVLVHGACFALIITANGSAPVTWASACPSTSHRIRCSR